MNIADLKAEVAVDLIGLINSLKGFKFNAEVQYGKTSFKYVTLDAILDKVKENGNFAVMLPLGTNEHGQAALQVVLVHKSGFVMISDYYVLRIGENAKKQDEGSAITYTKRYALGAFLGLCTDQDNDANPDGNGQGAKTPPKQNQERSNSQKSALRREIVALGKQLGYSSQEVATRYKVTADTSIEELSNIEAALADELASKGGAS